MPDIIVALVSAALGIAGGWLAARATQSATPEPPQSDAAAALAAARAQATTLRHDLRGILSPAMLVADRLIASEDEAVRRAGEVVLHTVERATERLVDDPADHVAATAPQQ